MQKKIKEEILFLNEIEKKINSVIKNAPNEHLRCANNRGYYQYYVDGKYMGKNKLNYVKNIAQKEYCLDLLKDLKEYKKILEKANKLYQDNKLEKVYRELYPGRKCLVEPLIMPIEDKISKFEKLEYIGKVFGEENVTEFFTAKGERVRSKSEKIIADELQRYGVPYKYEMPLELDNWNKKVVVYPDFTVLNCRTGKRWLLEHFGMMDHASYCETVMYKLDTYEKNGILLGDSLLMFHETSAKPLNVNVVRKYIELYLI